MGAHKTAEREKELESESLGFVDKTTPNFFVFSLFFCLQDGNAKGGCVRVCVIIVWRSVLLYRLYCLSESPSKCFGPSNK